MAGSRGPIPKLSETRLRRNKDVEIDAVPAGGFVPAPVEPDEKWHPIALNLWESAERSGQTKFYEESDWASLYLVCESISRDLKPQFIGFSEGIEYDDQDRQITYKRPVQASIPIKGAQMSAYRAWLAALLFTEGDRRRSAIELSRANTGEGGEPEQTAGQKAVLALVHSLRGAPTADGTPAP